LRESRKEALFGNMDNKDDLVESTPKKAGVRTKTNGRDVEAMKPQLNKCACYVFCNEVPVARRCVRSIENDTKCH
jgi:hypothetical protein